VEDGYAVSVACPSAATGHADNGSTWAEARVLNDVQHTGNFGAAAKYGCSRKPYDARTPRPLASITGRTLRRPSSNEALGAFSIAARKA